MDNWMKLLGSHYRRERTRRPRDKLLIVFDIDGTILDMRYMIRYVLKEIDRNHGTDHFAHLGISEIEVHEGDVDIYLDRLAITGPEKERILSSYRAALWSSTAVADAHEPFQGVFDVIRWFQFQENTFVGLNTGRPEALRFNTISSLNRLGERYSVHFSHDLLYMLPDDRPGSLPEAKVEGLRHFRSIGYRPIAMIDNEPENLEAIARHEAGRNMLLLHADTIFRSRPMFPSRKIIRGDSYNVDEFMDGHGLKRSA